MADVDVGHFSRHVDHHSGISRIPCLVSDTKAASDTFRLGMSFRQLIRPPCLLVMALTAVFVCDMQMFPFFLLPFFGGGG